jgi:nitrite reductase/ring-hydroxylating ferredoxin subunit
VSRGTEIRQDGRMAEIEVGPADALPPGTVTGAGGYAAGNADGELFAVTRRCRHLRADLAGGTIDADGCLVCPWHQSKYDVRTGQMVRGPQGGFARVPGLGFAFMSLTKVWPLGRGRVSQRHGTLYVE